MGELAQELGSLGLRPADASVLMLVEANPGVTQSEIGRELAIQRANMAPLTARLDDRGLVARERVDGRSHGLIATKAGRALCRDIRRVMDAHDARILSALPEDIRRAIGPGLAGLW